MCISDGQKAIAMWQLILEEDLAASRLGRQLAALHGTADEAAETMRTLNYTFEDKSTGTLRARACSILQFFRWHHTQTDRPAAPVEEQDVFSYLCFLEESSAAPTRAQRLLEALTFAFHVVGLELRGDLLSSRRLAGAALSSMKRNCSLYTSDAADDLTRGTRWHTRNMKKTQNRIT